MSFGEAAQVIEILHERSHDPRYVELVGLMLEQCSNTARQAKLLEVYP
jgi:hypothetical protein